MTPGSFKIIAPVQRTRPSPYYHATLKAGVKAFSVYNRMLFPIWYDSPEADYWHLINNVTIWDVACQRQIEISGPDAFTLTRMMTPRDISNCAVGRCMYVPIVDQDGGMINDPVLLRLAADRFWLSLADSDVLLWAKGLALGHSLDVQVHEPDASPLAIQGPNADALCARLLGDWISDLRFFRFREFELDGIPIIVARSGWSKQGGLELYLQDGQQGEKLWDMAFAAGKELDVKPAAPSAIERIESGLLSYGNDMTLEHNPLEIGLEKYCQLDQDFEFIGKAALRQIRAEGVHQKLVGIKFSGRNRFPNSSHWPVTANDQPVGILTSSTYSPRVGASIGLAMLGLEHTAEGTPVIVETPTGPATAHVHPVPFL
jgi:glycine cleavage system aminomethyltransferase T